MPVRKRPLGRTGMQVSELALGTWGLSGDGYGPVRDDEVDRVIDRAVTLGITLFDTADVYGNGDMERKLGKRLPAAKTHVITKIGTNLTEGYPIKQYDALYLREAFERSQDRLRRNVVDVVLLHNPTAYTMRSDEPFDLFDSLKSRAQLSAWGVSAGNVEVARLAIERGADVVMLAYNAFFSRDLMELSEDLLGPDQSDGDDSPATLQPRSAVIARSVLAHGLLTGHWSAEREFYDGDHRAERWNPDELRRRVGQLNALRPLVSGDIKSIRGVALRYVLENELISSAVLGPRSVTQLDQLVRDAGRKPPYLSDAALSQLARRLQAVGIVT